MPETSENSVKEISKKIVKKSVKNSDVIKIDPSLIIADESFNVRNNYGNIEELKESIALNGVKVTMYGYPHPEKKGMYYLTSGFRRNRALQELIKENRAPKYVEFGIEKKGYTPDQRIIDHILFNSGKPLNCMEEAEVFQRLMNLEWNQEDIARAVSKTQPHVHNRLKLATLSKFMKNQLIKEVLNATQAMTIMDNYPNEEDQKKVVKKAIEQMKKIGADKISSKSIKIKASKAKTQSKYHMMFSNAIDYMKEGNKSIYTASRIEKVRTIMKALDCKKPEQLVKKLLEVL